MEKQKCKENKTGKIYRFMQEDADTFFVYAPHSKRMGWRISSETFYDKFTPVVSDLSEEDKWHRRLRKAVKILDKSGLWPDIKEKFSQLLTVKYADREKIKEIFWNRTADYGEWIEKYPFMFSKTAGKYELNTGYIFELSECRLKSMYFGKYDNTREKEKIAACIRDKQKHSCWYTVNYDVSFEYDPDRNAAWYSEEYRGCGNGHYYLALNHSTALFCEDD